MHGFSLAAEIVEKVPSVLSKTRETSQGQHVMISLSALDMSFFIVSSRSDGGESNSTQPYRDEEAPFEQVSAHQY